MKKRMTDDEILFPSRSSPHMVARTSPSMAGRAIPPERDRASPGQTASDLLLQVLNGASAGPQLVRRSSELSNPELPSQTTTGHSIWDISSFSIACSERSCQCCLVSIIWCCTSFTRQESATIPLWLNVLSLESLLLSL